MAEISKNFHFWSFIEFWLLKNKAYNKEVFETYPSKSKGKTEN